MSSKRLLLSLFILTILHVSVFAADPIVLNEELQIQIIEPNVWLVVHRFPGACNSLLVQCAPGKFVWADTPVTNQATQRVHEWLIQTFADPNLIQINTGFHNDNLAGNAYLIEKGVPCYGADLTVRLLKEVWPKTVEKVKPYFQRKGKAYADTLVHNKMVPPDRLYPLAKGMCLQVGQETVEVFFPGSSHTLDNVVVYFQTRKLLYGGCMIKAANAKTPGFIADADMVAWPKSVQMVLERYPDTRLVVPGHGRWGGLELLSHTITLCD